MEMKQAPERYPFGCLFLFEIHDNFSFENLLLMLFLKRQKEKNRKVC